MSSFLKKKVSLNYLEMNFFLLVKILKAIKDHPQDFDQSVMKFVVGPAKGINISEVLKKTRNALDLELHNGKNGIYRAIRGNISFQHALIDRKGGEKALLKELDRNLQSIEDYMDGVLTANEVKSVDFTLWERIANSLSQAAEVRVPNTRQAEQHMRYMNRMLR